VTDKYGVPRKMRVEGIAYATWWHISSRERKADEEYGVGTGGDPHFHPHNLISKYVLPRGGTELVGMLGKDIQIAARALRSVDDGGLDRGLRAHARTAKSNGTGAIR
jgi:hypothetical protein